MICVRAATCLPRFLNAHIEYHHWIPYASDIVKLLNIFTIREFLVISSLSPVEVVVYWICPTASQHYFLIPFLVKYLHLFSEEILKGIFCLF